MKPFVVGFALLVMSLAAGAVPAPADPWTLMPALPTACYGQQDDFDEVLLTRIATLSVEIERQTSVNDELSHRFSNMDFSEKQRHMSDYMMQHPENAEKVMQAFQSMGTQESNDARGQALAEESRQRAALDGLFAQYKAAYGAAIGPINTRTRAVGDGPWDGGEKKALNAKADQEYEKVCVEWWKAGPFLTWLAGYKKVLLQDIPKQDEKAQLLKTNLMMVGIPTATYRSTAAMTAVKKYMEQAAQVFKKRNAALSRVE